MLNNAKSEIEKVLDNYGQVKGTQFLMYFNTYIKKSLKLIKNSKEKLDEFSASLVNYILNEHGQDYLTEYHDFFNNNLKNTELISELSKTGNKYINNSIGSSLHEQNKTNLESEEIKNSFSMVVPLDEQDDSEITITSGEEENKNIFGEEDICTEDTYSNDRGKCAVLFKKEGDIALSQNRINEAIKLYKKAVFADLKFADAWKKLGDAYVAKSEYHNALLAFDKALFIDYGSVEILSDKAIALYLIGETQEAITIANDILSFSSSEDIIYFKNKLCESKAEDLLYIIENQNACEKLDDYGLKIMKEKKLVNRKGEVTVIEGLYQLEDFTMQMHDFCKRKYASLGNDKVYGECIITTFYGAICATYFYSKNQDVYKDISSFVYLNDHIDLEFVDVNAEKILCTKAGEEKAEYIWGIISSYVQFAQSVFNSVSVLSDEIILKAMKNAYEIGMLTAFYYISGKDKKHILATKAEIDQALFKLAESSNDYIDPPCQSTRYCSVRTPSKVDIHFNCSKCGNISTLNVYKGEENLIDGYKNLASKFVDLGHKAEVFSICDECAQRYYPSRSKWNINNIVFSFIAKDSDIPVYSFPCNFKYNDFEYKIALSFLTGSDTIEKLADDTDTELESDVYLKHINSIIGSAKP